MQAQKPSGSRTEASTSIFIACDEVSFVAARIVGYRPGVYAGMSAGIASAMSIVQTRISRDSVQPSRHAVSYLLKRLNAVPRRYQQPRAPSSLEQA